MRVGTPEPEGARSPNGGRHASDPAIAAVFATLLGRPIDAIEHADHTWFFRIGADSLLTEGLWRVIDGGRVLVTSEDHLHQFGLPEPVDAAQRAMASLRDCPVTAIVIEPESSDLTLEVGATTRLEFVVTSCGYENWRLYAQGTLIVRTGGGVVQMPHPGVEPLPRS